MWDREYESMSRDRMTALQSERLIKCVSHAYEHVAPYRMKMEAAGVCPGDIRGIEDLRKLPFLTKDVLRDNYPFGLFAVPQSDIVRIHASSGTTGKSKVVGYTRGDIALWSEVMARTLAAAGVTREDTVHVAYGYGLFTGGLGAHYGAELIGAVTVPVSVGNTKRQIQLMVDFGATILCCTPSYAVHLAETMDEMGIDKSELKLRAGCFGAEPWTDEMRAAIEAGLSLDAYDIFGLTEIIGPGVAFECSEKHGLHINEDHFVPEIVDPDTGEPVPDGCDGELVFSCITKEALPLLRYRTHDIARILPGECACGRTLVRMSKPVGRTDDMLIIRGVNVFPSQVESVLLGISGTGAHYQLVVRRVSSLDTLEILVEMTPDFFSDDIGSMARLERRIRDEVSSVLGIDAQIRLVEPKTLERSQGKAVRVLDLRDK